MNDRQNRKGTRFSDYPFVRWIAWYVIIGFVILFAFGNQMPLPIKKFVTATLLTSFVGIPLFGLFIRRNLTQKERDAGLSPCTKNMIRNIVLVQLVILFVVTLAFFYPWSEAQS